jgi:hypothetical protein
MAAGALLAASQAEAQGKGDQWTFSITPYLWLPNVDGTLKYTSPPGSGGGPVVVVGPVNYLENLKFALMITGEIRKKRLGAFTDFIYLDFRSENSRVKAVDFGSTASLPIDINLDAGTRSSLKGGLWKLAGSYAAADVQAMHFSRPALGVLFRF